MCGRFVLKSPAGEIGGFFGVKADKAIPERYNIAPTQPVLIVRTPETHRGYPRTDSSLPRELAAVEWGLVPEWAKQRSDKPLINARSETAVEKPSFRASVKRKRCLVPFNGWYEWRSERGIKQPYYIEYKEGVGAFAGIWSTWHGEGGEHWLETVALLTSEATGILRDVHHRRPLVVKQQEFERWLTPHDPLPRGFMNSFNWEGPDAFHLRPVCRLVNNIRNDSQACLGAPEEMEPPRQASLF